MAERADWYKEACFANSEKAPLACKGLIAEKADWYKEACFANSEKALLACKGINAADRAFWVAAVCFVISANTPFVGIGLIDLANPSFN